MLVVTRERILDRLLALPALVDAYAGHESEFTERALEWLARTARVLAELRHPTASFVAAERGRAAAALEGELEPRPEPAFPSRKARRAAVMVSLTRTEGRLSEVVTELDRQLEGHREKLAQLLAVSSRVQPLRLDPLLDRVAALDRLWAELPSTPETDGMRAYLSARLSRADRVHLLGETWDQLVAGLGRSHGGDPSLA